ncbi:hypothetical protein B0T21DRAFT_288681 [Apiosordaria backusii]|uniref:Uncharacterized protein n=1 Tax=Apiosordaria backusii TaxID=314023 RepID=A0AA40BLU0_9PEZI|nr:hypothetical protein B0T21DRAFT_288681 [Apiosordaria backusii]
MAANTPKSQNTLTMESITASLTSRDISNAHEVSTLLLKIYQTLIHMQYLPPHTLAPGPHDLTHLFPLFEELQLSPQIIYLYQVIPYISYPDSHTHDFYMGGYYADFRQKNQVEDGRNTMYAEDRREQMRPWMTPLSLLCNHMCVLFYDSKTHMIGIFDQMSGRTQDRGLKEGHGRRMQLRTVEDLDGERRDDGHPRLGCGSKGANVYDDMPSRPAGDVLRDIIRQYETLEEVPWVYEHGSSRDWPEGVKQLFFKHGWPGPDFDVEAFELDRMRMAAMEEVMYRAMEPFRKVDRCKDWAEEANRPEMLMLKRQVATAETLDEEWLARFQIWKKEQEIEGAKKELAEAEAERDKVFPNGQKPGDKPEDWILCELRKWRQDIIREEEAIKYTTEQAEIIEGKRRHLELLHKVLEICKTDADRLCPGKAELPAEDKHSKISLYHSRAYSLDGSRKGIEALEEFRAKVPTTCQKTIDLIQQEVDMYNESINRSNEWWDRHDVALKEAEKRKEALAAIKSAAQKG